MRPLVLSSASPRRKELLLQIGIVPRICPSTAEEIAHTHEAASLVKELALQKNIAVAHALLADHEAEAGWFFLGADTVVVKDGDVLGKPGSPEEAAAMLGRLQGGVHQVYTGVSVFRITPEGGIPSCEEEGARLFAVSTEVEFAPMTQAEIEEYVATGEPLDKAGAYGIQGIFARYVQRIHGEYTNVVGLPVAAVYRALQELHYFD